MKKRVTYTLICLITLALNVSVLRAQDSTGALRTWMKELQDRYHNAGYLAFHMKYLYTNAGAATALDSLTGEVEMNGSRCRLLIDSTETVVTDKYTIQVRPEEKMIVLSGARPAGNLDPIGLMDSLLAHTANMHARITRDAGHETLAISFPPDREYSSVRITKDTRTGWIQLVSYNVRTTALVGQDMVSRPGHPAPYRPEGKIDILFSGYRRGGFSQAMFDEGNYFNRIDGRYEAAARYKDYKIFLASSNL
ncbi:MAG: hypothetical protein JST39_24975 [Bacteroidetes bacterium]|nr:hypothetical protein [Bacteroidota bacterium]